MVIQIRDIRHHELKDGVVSCNLALKIIVVT